MPDPRTLARVHETLAGLLAVLILVLAVIAGRWMFGGDLDIEVHGWIGNGVFALTIANLIVALVRWRRGALTTGQIAVAGLIAALTFGQVGLGYVGREQLDAASVHVPNGVLLMGLTTFQWAGIRYLPLARAT